MKGFIFFWLCVLLSCSEVKKTNDSQKITESISVEKSNSKKEVKNPLNILKSNLIKNYYVGNIKLPCTLSTLDSVFAPFKHEIDQDRNSIYYNSYFVFDEEFDLCLSFYSKDDFKTFIWASIQTPFYEIKNGIKIGTTLNEVLKIFPDLRVVKYDTGEYGPDEKLLIADSLYSNILFNVASENSEFVGTYSNSNGADFEDTTSIFEKSAYITNIEVFGEGFR